MLTDRAVRLSTAKAYVIYDSVLCVGRISESPVSAWKDNYLFMISSQCRELDRIDGGLMEFEWKKFLRIHNIADSRRDPQHDD